MGYVGNFCVAKLIRFKRRSEWLQNNQRPAEVLPLDAGVNSRADNLESIGLFSIVPAKQLAFADRLGTW